MARARGLGRAATKATKKKPAKRTPKRAPKKRGRAAAEFCTCPPGAKVDYSDGSGTCRRGTKRVDFVCSSTSPTYRLKQPRGGKSATPAAFDYWTPSTVTKSTAAQRKKRGCVVETISYVSKKGAKKGQTLTKKVPLPYRCPPGSKPNEANGTCLGEGGKELEPVRDAQCGPQANPCAQSRKTCPVQLVYRDGKPNLRFCITAGNKKPGFLVPVQTAREANQLAEDACAHWRKSGKKFTKSNPAHKLAVKAYPKEKGLGGKKKRKRKRAS